MTHEHYILLCVVIIPGLIILTVHTASFMYVTRDCLASEKTKLEKGFWIASVTLFGAIAAIQYYARKHPKFDKAMQYICLIVAVVMLAYYGGQVWIG